MSTISPSAAHRPHGHDTIDVHGQLDLAGLARLRAELAARRAAGARHVFVDLSDMANYPAGLARALCWAKSQLRASGACLVIVGAPQRLCAELADAADTFSALPDWDYRMPTLGVPVESPGGPDTPQQP